MRQTIDLKMKIRMRNVHFFKENIRHIFVEMLSGMDNYFFHTVGFMNTSADGCRLYKLRPGTNNCNYFFQFSKLFNTSLSCPVRFRREYFSIPELLMVK